MDRTELIQAFERLLETEAEPLEATVGLAQVFTELAALRTEVRGEGRQARQTLDTLRQALETLERECARHGEALERARREALRPLLLDLLELRDRLGAAVEALEKWRPGWFKRRLLGRELERLAAILQGQRLMLERFDRWLAGFGLQPIEAVGETFDPRLMRAAEVVQRQEYEDGLVVEELRRGYLWDGEVLRPAEVCINRRHET